MNDYTKSSVTNRIAALLSQINSNFYRKYHLNHPSYLFDIKEKHKLNIGGEINNLSGWLSFLDATIVQLNLNKGAITEQTIESALYLLLNSIISQYGSTLLLAEHGKFSDCMHLFRRIGEATDLCDLFLREYEKGDNENLISWFSGSTIDNSKSRKSLSLSFEKCFEFNTDYMLSSAYQFESQWSHNGYSSILEGVSPFTKDFDFDGHLFFGRTLQALTFTRNGLTNLSVTIMYIIACLNRNTSSVSELMKLVRINNPTPFNKKIPDIFSEESFL